ncbi:MAG TPA: DUF5329 family protein [Cytophagaceae bacterium]|jgi:hypothetical protein
MKSKVSGLAIFCLFFSTLFSSAISNSTSLSQQNKYSEREKIELLLQSIKSLKDVKFERNGSVHEADAAVKLLKSKLNKVGIDNVTAQEFIEKIASKSSTSGQPYYIIYPNGSKITAGEFLKKKLQEIESRN